jgi:chaperonin GroES
MPMRRMFALHIRAPAGRVASRKNSATCARLKRARLDIARGRTYFLACLLALANCECQQTIAISLCRQATQRRRGLAQQRKTDMAFRPLHDRVVVKRLEGEEKTKGGIIIPDTAKEKPQEGKVISVGPGARDESGKLTPLDVKAGDRVLFGKWSGTEVKVDGEDLLIMKESDILGVVE